jgi:hypothetical protein
MRAHNFRLTASNIGCSSGNIRNLSLNAWSHNFSIKSHFLTAFHQASQLSLTLRAGMHAPILAPSTSLARAKFLWKNIDGFWRARIFKAVCWSGRRELNGPGKKRVRQLIARHACFSVALLFSVAESKPTDLFHAVQVFAKLQHAMKVCIGVMCV